MRFHKRINDRLTQQWIQQFIHTAVVCFLFMLMEWLFNVTKPSFLSKMDWIQKSVILFKGFLFFTAICFGFLILLILLSLIKQKSLQKLVLSASSLLPAGVLSCTFLLMVDNFTYTVFSFGVVSSQRILRAVYMIGFCALFYGCFKLFNLLLSLNVRRVLPKLAVLGILLSSFVFIIPFQKMDTKLNVVAGSEKLPNIILIGSDGLSANHMSVYGYERDTTPRITEFASDALIVENNFTNAKNTAGSIISILTGKYPTETRVLFPPDTLSGIDTVQHLCGILKQLGYYNVEWSVPYYADANALGLLNGFDESNGQIAATDAYSRLAGISFDTDVAFYISSIFEKISDRLLHIFFIKTMANPYSLVTSAVDENTDREKISSALSYFDKEMSQPLFIHVHLMGTHGPEFYPDTRVFSKDQEQTQKWMPDFYDDSILEFDQHFGDLVDGLKEKGVLENTIVILYSDHAEGENWNQRIPLIMRFPSGEYQDLTIHQSENLDIAPTLLDYLNVEIPSWMSGSSLIDPSYSRQPTLSARSLHALDIEGLGWVLDEDYLDPPFYQFDSINVTDCQNIYAFDLTSYTMSQHLVENYMNPCSESELLPLVQIFNILQARLINDGFSIPPELEQLFSSTK